jgi:hypothetical protein
MTHDEQLRALRDIVQVDPGNRGLARDPVNNLFTACPDDFANACRSIANHPSPRVGIVTGFMIPNVNPPTGETDGPPGALLLADAFNHLQIPFAVLTDQSGYNALRVGLDLLNLTPGFSLIELPMWFRPEQVLEPIEPLTHLIALERSGPSHAAGRNCTMRGFDITELTSSAHFLFEGERNYVTIGIGDGGNEIGMGKIPYATICKNIRSGPITACRTVTDFLIVAGVSNWGAVALATGVMLLRGNVDRSCINITHQLRCLTDMVNRGPLVDGVTGKQEITVDGLLSEEYFAPIAGIFSLLDHS